MLTVRQALSAAAAAAFLILAGCGDNGNRQEQPAVAANAGEKAVVPDIPLPQPPLDREQLLVAVMHAASDFATGTDDRQAQKGLADKKFEFRIRFGCGAPEKTSAGPFGWSFDDAAGTLKVRATPDLTTSDPAIEAIAGDAYESAEGFWIERPWILSAACATQPAAGSGTLKAVGLAQFFAATDPRTARRSGRPYETTQKVEDGKAPAQGFDLILTGRLVALPDGRVIACSTGTAGERPSCVVSAEFGAVSIERADTHEQLAQWGSG